MIQRLVNPIKSNSFFLFGARGTGKSTFIREQFSRDLPLFSIDLLNSEIEDLYARNPSRLEAEVKSIDPRIQWIFIDEVQRVPKLLNSVHRLIESTNLKFILTGSSARRLKRGSANLLAGRAFVQHLFPLTTLELGNSFDLNSVLQWGSLPKLLTLNSDEEKTAYLRAYALTYLREEIQAEQLVRRLDPFRLFLEVAAQTNGKILNYSRIAREVGADIKTVQSYFQILEDTWIGFHLPAYHRSVRKSQKAHPKFYLFDLGVKRALERSLGASLMGGTSAFGEAFEHWVILEFYRFNEYFSRDYKMSYLGTKDGLEVDLILSRPKEPPLLIEIKSTTIIDEIEVRKLNRLSTDFKHSPLYYLSRDPHPLKIENVQCLPWQEGLQRIFNASFQSSISKS